MSTARIESDSIGEIEVPVDVTDDSDEDLMRAWVAGTAGAFEQLCVNFA